MIQVPAQVVNMNPRADRSWKIVFETRELTGEDVKVLADSFQGEGWLVFKPNSLGVELADVPEGVAEVGTKSQSQRLRAVMFLYWKHLGKKGDFDSFYRTQYEKLIELYKEKLPEEV